MGARAGIVVTGTEVLTGIISDRNGPWVAQQLIDLGVEVAEIAIVGDRPEDLRGALTALERSGCRLICTTGGLGPTEDDLTAQVVAAVQERPMALDEALERRIWAVLEPILRRWPELSPEALRRSNRKQALVPEGATVLEPVGTAPGLVVPPPAGRDGATILVLPGPPRELQEMWPVAVATDAVRSAIAGAVLTRASMLRIYDMPESEIAETMRLARGDGIAIDGLEITTCMRQGELEVVTRAPHERDALHDRWIAFVRDRHRDGLYSDDGSTVDEVVAAMLTERGLTIATAESCTGGLLAGRLTARAGSSAYVRGGVVVYANDAKTALAGVPAEMIARHGAVSEEVAAALATGARTALTADVGVGITGVAGPGGGTEAKPVGTVFLAVAGPDGSVEGQRIRSPGGRSDVRERAVTVALHLVRRHLQHGDDRR